MRLVIAVSGSQMGGRRRPEDHAQMARIFPAPQRKRGTDVVTILDAKLTALDHSVGIAVCLP